MGGSVARRRKRSVCVFVLNAQKTNFDYHKASSNVLTGRCGGGRGGGVASLKTKWLPPTLVELLGVIVPKLLLRSKWCVWGAWPIRAEAL